MEGKYELAADCERDGGRFALMGTTAAPAFDLADFALADRETLLTQYPACNDLILRLTPDQ